MILRRFVLTILFTAGSWIWFGVCSAEEPEVAPVGRSDTKALTPAPKKNKSKGKRTREKEAEGTEAPNRFEADTVIKSQYRLNGESLEVDPD